MDFAGVAASLLPGVGTVALAMLSGAGGSALLELIWKPRRDRRKVAGTLLGEILGNTELALLWAHARQKNPKQIPADLSFSNIGWQAASGLISELPPDLIKDVLLMYRRYEHLNFCIAEYGKTFEELQAVEKGSPREATVRRHLDTTIDVFNTGIDTAFEQGKTLAGKLLHVAGIKERVDPSTPVRNYDKVVEELLGERARRLDALNQDGDKG